MNSTLEMTPTSPKGDVGFIIGRFQVHKLHEAHKALIQSVCNKHLRVIVFLGVSPLRNTKENPLDFRSRKSMIQEQFPNVEIYYVNDRHSDEVWSKQLDKLIAEHLLPTQTCVLYGSRESFIRSYSGKHATCELESNHIVSGTQLRKEVSNFYHPSEDYRAGMIAATAHRHPTSYQAVDIAIFRNDGNEILMAKKPDEEFWRFAGGFSDPNSLSLEHDAKREVMEELGIEVGDMVYVGSTLVDDWRYKREIDKIKTVLFMTDYVFGAVQAQDDISEAKWFQTIDILKSESSLVMPAHKPLAYMLNAKLLKGCYNND